MSLASNPAKGSQVPETPRRITPPPASNRDVQETCDVGCETIASLVTACQKGDRAASRRLYDSCHQSIFRLVTRMVGPQEAPDVMQQVFLQAFRSIGQFNGQSGFQTWLYRLAVNESLQHLRRLRRWRFRLLDWEPMEESQHGENSERKELLEQALARIDPELRSIFLLREIDNLSYHEIAEALNIPEGTVGSRLNRARRELKQQLSNLGFELP